MAQITIGPEPKSLYVTYKKKITYNTNTGLQYIAYCLQRKTLIPTYIMPYFVTFFFKKKKYTFTKLHSITHY